jgi:predicted transcriptional regulator
MVRSAGVGPLEHEVLEIMWDWGGWLTPPEVYEIFVARRDLAYTTVMTVMSNLWKKDLLERRRDGRTFAYHPRQSREERAARLMADALAVGKNRPAVLASFLTRLTPAERAQLRRMLGTR